MKKRLDRILTKENENSEESLSCIALETGSYRDDDEKLKKDR